MRERISAFLGLPVAVLTVAGLSFGFQDPDPAPPLSEHIGVVNALKARDAHPKFIEANAAFQKRDQTFRESVRQLENGIQQLELELRSLDAGATNLREAKSFQIEMSKRELEGRVLMHERSMTRDLAALFETLYAEIWDATEKVAEAKGLKLVLRKREPGPGMSPQDLQRLNERVTVAYAAPELDVTEHVIRLLQ